jgi:type IV secretion system protein VirD4
VHWKTKFCLGLTLLFAAVAGAIYLSGFLTLTLLGVEGPTSWRTAWDYWQATALPQFVPFVWKIKLACGLGVFVPTAAWIAALIPLIRSKPQSLHGSSRFAHKSDLAKAGLLTDAPNGIVVGKFGNSLIRLSGQQFVILAAPTRSGKGVGVVIPNLLEYQESMVVLDIKQENFDLTSGWRASQDQEIFLFNPFAEDRRTHRWNPLSYVSPDPSFRISDIQSIAAMLYPDGNSDQKFWVSQARNAFTAFTLYLFESYDVEWKEGFAEHTRRFPTLGEVYRLSSGDGSNLRVFLKGLSDRPFLSPDAKTAFANLLSQEEKTFASILGTFKEPLNAWINPVLDAATSCNDFLLTDVRKKKMTIYIGIQPSKLAESRLIVNLFFSQLINVNTKELPQNNPALKHQCLLLMDEFTSIGKVEILAASVSYMAGYNMRLLPIIQSMAQLDATYGKDVSRTIITNHALQIIYAPREQQDANDYSEMLGYTTVSKESVTRGRDVSKSRSDERRALMLPQELKAMGADKEVILFEGIPHPVKCDKIRYYEDRRFTRRLMPKVEVPELTLREREMLTRKGKAAIAAGILLSTTAVAKPQAQPIAAKPVPPVGEAAPNLPEGRVVADRFLNLIGSLEGWGDLAKEKIESAMGYKLVPGDNGKYWNRVGEMRDGSHFSVTYYPATLRAHPTLALNVSPPKPEGVFRQCPILFDDVRQKFLALGFAEDSIRTDIGSSIGLVYSRGELSFSLDAITTSPIDKGEKPVLCLSTLLTYH